MSVIISILQSIFQTIGWIMPISESGHSTIYHTFAGRADGSFASVTGAVHIGIAIGITVAMLKFFITLTKDFFGCGVDLVQRRFSYREAKPARVFMLMTLISFALMVFWLLPLGSKGFLFTALSRTAYNGTLIDDGIFLAITGALVFFASRQLENGNNNKTLSIVPAVIVGVASLFLVPVSGLSLIGGVWAILVLFGISRKLAYRYAFVMSVPVLLVMGIVQLATAEYKSSIAEIIIALILSAGCAFLLTRVFKNAVKKGLMKYIATYEFGIAGITLLIGIIQFLTR